MFRLLKVRKAQGWQFVRDIRNADPKGFRGRPQISTQPCVDSCSRCAQVCPTGAIELNPLRLDLGLCTFCGVCEEVCPAKKIKFTNDYKLSSTQRDRLVVGESNDTLGAQVSREINRLFKRSLKLRSVSAGGCNACELEMNALSNVNFDMGRFGIEFVASPRHADGLVLTGPISKNMAEALKVTFTAMPEPRFVIAVGTCAISGGLYKNSPQIERNFLQLNIPGLYVPGCPPHPLTFLTGILDLLGRIG